MNAGFEEIFNLYNPITYSVGDILDTYAYRIGLVEFDYSYSTTISLFKNVIGLLSIQGGQVLEYITSTAQKMGYTTDVFTLNAADFGVAQTRRRIFVVGMFGNTSPRPPTPTHKKTPLIPWGSLCR